MHLAIVYEHAQWGKRSPGSKVLRRLLRKFTQVDGARNLVSWGSFFIGTGPASLNREEAKARQEILDGSMGQGRAKLILENVDPDTPFYSRVTFIEGLAAICRCFPEEVGRKVTGSNKEVAKVLWSAAAPERLEWLFNNLRIWHAMTPLQRALLPSGTASNEALHAERMDQSQQDAAPKHLAAQIAHHAVWEATWWMALA